MNYLIVILLSIIGIVDAAQIHKEITLCQPNLDSLTPDHPFLFVDVGLTKNDIQTFEALTITENKFFKGYGLDLRLLEKQIFDFMGTVGNNDNKSVQLATRNLIKLISAVLKMTKQEDAEIVMRATTPSRFFEIPRWHMDGNYYDGPNFPKFVMALKGPTTLFYPASAGEKKEVNAHTVDVDIDDTISRKYLAQLLDTKKIMQPQKGQGAFFLVGGKPGYAAVHSEPDKTEPRLFIAMVLGSKQQIEQMVEKQKKMLEEM